MAFQIIGGTNACKKSIVGVSVEIPEDLLEYFESMARHAEKSFEEYVEYIVTNHNPSTLWPNYPPEVAILLTLYQWAYAERDRSIRAIRNIWRS